MIQNSVVVKLIAITIFKIYRSSIVWPQICMRYIDRSYALFLRILYCSIFNVNMRNWEENYFGLFQISKQIQATKSMTYKIFRHISIVHFKVVLRPLPIKILKSILHINKFNVSWFAQQTLWFFLSWVQMYITFKLKLVRAFAEIANGIWCSFLICSLQEQRTYKTMKTALQSKGRKSVLLIHRSISIFIIVYK